MANEYGSQAIAHDVEQLRQRFSNTQELYREVCALLFFRYGITPTANKLYQLVKKGSMSAPAEALSVFWNNLREKSRVRIEGPDLPDTICDAAAQLVGQLWQQAQLAAQDHLAQAQAQAQVQVQQAQNEVEQAQQETQAALQANRMLAKELGHAQQQRDQIKDELSAARSILDTLKASLAAAQQRQQDLDQQLKDSHMRFTDELEKLHGSLEQAEERARSAEKRWLLEIDRERMGALKAIKERDNAHAQLQEHLKAAQAAQEQAQTRHETQISSLQSALNHAQSQSRSLEQALHEKDLALTQARHTLERLAVQSPNASENQGEQRDPALPARRKPVPSSRLARRRRVGLV